MSKPPVVAYFYDEHATNHVYTFGHPWRPFRSKMVETLVDGYGLKSQMLVHRPVPRTFEQLTEFHADDYIEFLEHITPDNVQEFTTQLKRFNMGAPGESDCPVFDGMLEYFSLLSGGSVDGAALLANKDAQIAVNWAGGMHHAKKAEASGFCFVNDIVLAILELLKTFTRVLYVDIDIHHGDGVEEAFYLTDRVMTVSFHRYGDYFPGTGSINDIGYGKGKHYTVNVPLQDGVDDESYRMVYEPIMTKVMEMYQPEAIVVCSGADSLSGDRLGCFNLSLQGHSNCVEFLARYQVPLLVVGGGGYTLRNVARCWTYETGRLMGIDLPDELPLHALSNFNYYMDTERLRIQVSNMRNANRREDLEAIRAQVLENLRDLPPVPSAPLSRAPPPTKIQDLPEEDMDARGGGAERDERRVVRPGDESDDEEVAGAGRRTPWEAERRAAGERFAGERFGDKGLAGEWASGMGGQAHGGGPSGGYSTAGGEAGMRPAANGAGGHAAFGGARQYQQAGGAASGAGGGARANGGAPEPMQVEGPGAASTPVQLEADEQLDPAMDDEPMGQQHHQQQHHAPPQQQQLQQGVQQQQHKQQPMPQAPGARADNGSGGGAYRPGLTGLDGAFIQQLAGSVRPQPGGPMPGVGPGGVAGAPGVTARMHPQQQQEAPRSGSPRAAPSQRSEPADVKPMAQPRPQQGQLQQQHQPQQQQLGYQHFAAAQPRPQLAVHPLLQQQPQPTPQPQQQPGAAWAPGNNRTNFNAGS